MIIPSHFSFESQPKAAAAAIVLSGSARFTVLSEHMIRMEYSPSGNFEDRPSQAVWYRLQPVPEFTQTRMDGVLEIVTHSLQLRYLEGKPFRSDTLSIHFLGTPATWKFGMEQKDNLLGTTRTLDGVDGAIKLEPGLLSRRGWTLIDDSFGLVFGEDNWLTNRVDGALDFYFIHYGHDYRQGLAEFYRISGKPGLVPRWALGNWWSRYWAYTADELSELMREFRDHNIPLGVCIIDMDWHLTQTGNGCSGWTGYTWNPAYFPDPRGFIRFLHDMGLKTGLNLHPAEGVWPHEAMYPQMARAMGIDPESKQPVKFDAEDQKFVQAYFDHLHHPKEAEGIDFWWMDWQQGNPSRLPGLNLLWWINHLHYHDSGRDPQKRSFLFSRWGGLGNHRYPIGFSGDTVVSWASLAFQPYMTATAANVGYSWWSHDIGGHMAGMEDGELYTRWVQFGVFSPILRLHSTKNIYHERRPWGYDERVEQVASEALRLRHRLIPYIYSMAWKDHKEGLPLVRPLYHLDPDADEAYASPNVYTFGTELLAAPFTSPADRETRLARQIAWLPGMGTDWYGFFDGRIYPGGQWHSLYGGLGDIPVFARSGAIVPLAPKVGWGGLDNPREIEVHIFPGATNTFELYEDDGESQVYLQGEYALTSIEQIWESDRQVLRIHPAQGEGELLPEARLWTLVFHNIFLPAQVEVTINGKILPAQTNYDPDAGTLRLNGLWLDKEAALTVTLLGGGIRRDDHRSKRVKQLVETFRLKTELKNAMTVRVAELDNDPFRLADFSLALTKTQLQALCETLLGAGLEKRNLTGEQQVIFWNNAGLPQVNFLYSVERAIIYQPEQRYTSEMGSQQRSRVIFPERELGASRALWAVDYGGLLRIEERYVGLAKSKPE